jgi:RNA polymerase sigma-70 factor (ECF subfamily)
VVGDEQASVRAAFALLPDRDRELLELRVVAGLSSEEVAAILDMRPGAVRTAQARALDKLRAVLGGAEGVGS